MASRPARARGLKPPEQEKWIQQLTVKDGVKVQIADGLACPKFDGYNVKQERKRRPPQTSIRKRRPTKNMISISKYKLHWNNQNGVFC
jgi:hypothetical protein